MGRYTNVKILSIVITSLLIISFEFLRHKLFMHSITSNTDIFVSSVFFVIAAIAFSQFVFNLIENIERKRQQQEREARTLFDNSMDGIFIFNLSGTLTDMNHGAENMCEWTNEEAVGIQTLDSLFELELVLEDIHSSIKIEECMLTKKEGRTMPVSITFSYIPNDRKEEVLIAGIVRDLSERKEMENVIKELYREASQKQFEAETQYRIAKKIASVRDLAADNKLAIVESVTKEINKLLFGEFIGLFLYDFSQQQFELITITDHERHEEILNLFALHKNHTISSQKNKVSFIPLKNENLILGYLTIGEQKDTVWSLHQQELMKSIVNILTISFENVRMYQKMKDIAILDERDRLSREMHDGLAQVISSIHMKIEYMKVFTKTKDTDCCGQLVDLINELDKVVNEAYHEVRHNLFNLRTPIITENSFIHSLENYVIQFGKQNALKTEFSIQPHEYEKNSIKYETLNKELEIPDFKQMHVIRILQEALSNVRRHSQATYVHVGLFYYDDHSLFTIEDNGVGFDLDRESFEGHYGLITMKERANLVHGILDIYSKPGAGAKVSLRLPKEGGVS